MQREYTCITKQGKWNFYADDDFEAIRLSLFYCWRDGDTFVRVECSCQRAQSRSLLRAMPSAAEFGRSQYRHGAESYTLRISHLDHNSHESFTL